MLLNGRRVAAHGLHGSAVDLNQIPFAAIDRVEVLKDGASAIYGTDAIGGVINFITKNDFQGVCAQRLHRHYRARRQPDLPPVGTVGYGDLRRAGFQHHGRRSARAGTASCAVDDRDFVNGNQPNRGLSIDTRGTPIATAFPMAPTRSSRRPAACCSGAVAAAHPGHDTNANGGINMLDLPGGAGCETIDGGMAYDHELWANAPARLCLRLGHRPRRDPAAAARDADLLRPGDAGSRQAPAVRPNSPVRMPIRRSSFPATSMPATPARRRSTIRLIHSRPTPTIWSIIASSLPSRSIAAQLWQTDRLSLALHGLRTARIRDQYENAAGRARGRWAAVECLGLSRRRILCAQRIDLGPRHRLFLSRDFLLVGPRRGLGHSRRRQRRHRPARADRAGRYRPGNRRAAQQRHSQPVFRDANRRRAGCARIGFG